MRTNGAPSRRYRRHPLSYRAALRRAFGGMATTAGLILLAWGGYLIHDQFADPVGSHPGGLLLAAVLIATGLILLAFLIHPGVQQKSKIFVACEVLDVPAPKETATTRAVIDLTTDEGIDEHEAPREFSLQSRFVDHARIRP